MDDVVDITHVYVNVVAQGGVLWMNVIVVQVGEPGGEERSEVHDGRSMDGS